MNNLNVLILGQTGSGKTSLAKRLLDMTPRAFIFDPQDDYDHVAPFYSFRDAADFYIKHHARRFHLVYRGPLNSYVAWLDILFKTQRRYEDEPLGIFLDESSLYSSSHSIDDYLERVYTQGRRQRISVVTVTQRDTQINPIIRANSQVWVSMRQRKFSTDVKQIFTPAELDAAASLATYSPFTEGLPVEGKHFIMDPPEFPLFERWAELNQGGTDG